ncbi:MAG: Tm-1-like ATP-binding domain-containing protein [Phycisphaerales bacterium]|nr:Tm-1-like ATP-binding domain-containing protein [Phycisphaerales bacterium]
MSEQRPSVLCLGTLDTKGPETRVLAEGIRQRGCDTIILDCGILGGPEGVVPDISREEAARAAGTTIEALRDAGSRGAAIEQMLKGVQVIGQRLLDEGRLHGVVALGGAEGSVLAAATMTQLPVGLPKLLVSPIASGRRIFDPFVGTRDVTVMHSVVDILGLNSIAMEIFENASAAIAGMAIAFHSRSGLPGAHAGGQQVAATMLGNTTRPLMWIREQLAAEQQELVIFHANGVGGAAMEEAVLAGHFTGVIDYTLSELAGEVAGGFHVCADRTRLVEAGRLGLPQVIVPGCVDFTVHGPRTEIPEDKQGRPSHYHNPKFTLVRLTAEEQLEVGRRLVTRVNDARGPVVIVLPMGGLSVPDAPGAEFQDAAISGAFRDLLRNQLSDEIELVEVDAHINDQDCAKAVLAAWRSVAGHRKVGPSHAEGEPG